MDIMTRSRTIQCPLPGGFGKQRPFKIEPNENTRRVRRELAERDEKLQISNDLYQFDPEDAGDIIYLTSYRHMRSEMSVININPRYHRYVGHSICQTVYTPRTNLGYLDKLPLELLHDICINYLDLRSLFTFRHTNRRAQIVVHNIRGYRTFTTHALGALCAIFRSQIARWYTLRDLLGLLYQRDCTFCGRFGGYVSLTSFTRCCYLCLSHLPQLEVATVDEITMYYSLAEEDLEDVPKMWMVGGQVYSWPGFWCKWPIHVVAEGHISGPDGCGFIDQIRFLLDPAFPKNPHPLRLMTATHLPYVDRASGHVEYGVACIGCAVGFEGIIRADEVSELGDKYYHLEDIVYSEEGFIKHFRQCPISQVIWEECCRACDLGQTVDLEELSIRKGWYKIGKGPGEK
ncbi:hypothetical protein P168DRAFT_292658 [Aspergillus campestris IBT 28561]|uniref:F-box domain-containing protein n=1 Tax=Aspergillus campestris (strain IBT 28561) TaxID=1392248 RepID=A0A2I1CVB3_ASPC2|nr:uncharacterized protein P168DRAFT_292658 [Aspergillus campestris IBT 28561]PKY01555.1 hypothetical protein P168DRAFT_292658 [Aspergillus campestris IBT 28561]